MRGAMVTEKRIYSTKSLIELKQIASANMADSKVIEKIKHELGFRKKAAAKQLLSELEAGAPISLSPQRKTLDAPTSSASIHSDCVALEASYEVLRATFSEQGSVLARWGLTESMPNDLLIKVVSLWIEKFNGGYTHVIRSQEQLLKDCKFLGIAVPKAKKN
jgi:hypothetical protein